MTCLTSEWLWHRVVFESYNGGSCSPQLATLVIHQSSASVESSSFGHARSGQVEHVHRSGTNRACCSGANCVARPHIKGERVVGLHMKCVASCFTPLASSRVSLRIHQVCAGIVQMASTAFIPPASSRVKFRIHLMCAGMVQMASTAYIPFAFSWVMLHRCGEEIASTAFIPLASSWVTLHMNMLWAGQ